MQELPHQSLRERERQLHPCSNATKLSHAKLVSPLRLCLSLSVSLLLRCLRSLCSLPLLLLWLLLDAYLCSFRFYSHRDSVGGGGYISVSSTFNNTESYFKFILNLLWCKHLFSVLCFGAMHIFCNFKICSANVTFWMLAFCKPQETLHRIYWLAADC